EGDGRLSAQDGRAGKVSRATGNRRHGRHADRPRRMAGTGRAATAQAAAISATTRPAGLPCRSVWATTCSLPAAAVGPAGFYFKVHTADTKVRQFWRTFHFRDGTLASHLEAFQILSRLRICGRRACSSLNGTLTSHLEAFQIQIRKGHRHHIGHTAVYSVHKFLVHRKITTLAKIASGLLREGRGTKRGTWNIWSRGTRQVHLQVQHRAHLQVRR